MQCLHDDEMSEGDTGYYRPIEHWNDGKKQEFEKRTEYRISDKIAEEVNFGNGGEGGKNCEKTFVNSNVAPESFVQPAASMSVVCAADSSLTKGNSARKRAASSAAAKKRAASAS